MSGNSNLALVLGTLVAGAVVVDYGVKNFKGAFSSAAAGTPTPMPTGGGSSGGTTSTPNSQGAVNPFSKLLNFVGGRTDQGVDATAKAGSQIVAPFTGTVTAVNQNWFEGQPQIVLQGAPGTAFANKFFYVAEQLVPGVTKGQAVNAGDPIATYAASGTGIEAGWAANASGETLAAGTTGYTEGEQTPAGKSFLSFLQSIGGNV